MFSDKKNFGKNLSDSGSSVPRRSNSDPLMSENDPGGEREVESGIPKAVRLWKWQPTEEEFGMSEGKMNGNEARASSVI